RDLVVEVNRHQVAGRLRVPEGLVVVDVLDDLARRRLTGERAGELVPGRVVAALAVGLHTTEERDAVLLVHELTVGGVARLVAADERRARRLDVQADGCTA